MYLLNYWTSFLEGYLSLRWILNTFIVVYFGKSNANTCTALP